MAKRQVRKHGKDVSSRLEPLKLYQKLMETADARAKIPENQEKILHLSDTEFLKTAEHKLSKPGKLLLHFLLYGDFTEIDKSDPETFRPSMYIISSCEKPVRQMLKMVSAQMLTEMITPEVTSADVDLGDIIKRLATIERRMPDEYHDDDILRQEWRHAHALFADATTTGLFDMLNWDFILEKTDYFEFAVRMMNFIDTVITEEQLAPFLNRREQLIQHTINQMVKHIPKALEQGNRDLAEAGYLRIPEPPKTNLLMLNPIKQMPLTPANPLFECFTGSPFAKIRDDLLSADPWMIAFAGLLNAYNLDMSVDFSTETLEHFTIGEIAFTAFSLLAESKETNIFNCITEIILTELLLTRSSNEAVQDLLRVSEDNDSYWEFNSTHPVRFSSEMKTKIQKHDAYDNYLTPKGFNLMNLILLHTNIVPHRIIRIHNKLVPILNHMGYDDVNAAALCGYMEGLKCQSKHAASMAVFLHYDEQVKAEEDAEEEENQNNEQKISDLTTQLETVQKQVNEQMEEAKRKHIKEKKTLQHHVMQAEDQMRTLQNENASLKAQIKALEAERTQLQNTMIEFNLKEKDQTDLTSQDEESTIQYPSNIGQNLKILCFGGSANWVATQHRRFPYIGFYGYGDTMNPSSVTDADIILVNTFVLKHAMYWPLKNEADRVGKEIFTFPAKGINSGSNYIVATYNHYRETHPDVKE